jgi:hypothetical protein
MKLQKKSESITPCAGISFAIEECNKCGLFKLIDNHFCIRCLTGYQ